MFSKNLKNLRNSKGLSQKEIAEKLFISQQGYAKYEVGTSTPNPEMLSKIADILNCNVEDLIGREKKKGARIPVFGKVAAGIPIETIEDIEDYEEIDASWLKDGSEFFALKISGESMEPRIKDGDVVIVRKQPTIENGQTAIVTIDGEYATCKKIKKTPGGIMLISTNPAYEPMVFTNKEIEELPIRILGRVVELRAKF